jgi:hypothetical protein
MDRRSVGPLGSVPRLLLSDQVGFIYVIGDGRLVPGSFLNLSDAVKGPSEGPELGLSGFAPHPDFAENGRFFVPRSCRGSCGPSMWTRPARCT